LADGKKVDEFVFPSHRIDKAQEPVLVEEALTEQPSIIDEIAEAFTVANDEESSSLTSVHLFDDSEASEDEDEPSYLVEAEVAVEDVDTAASTDENIAQNADEKNDASTPPKVARPSWLENRR
jgi:hypothetical protein